MVAAIGTGGWATSSASACMHGGASHLLYCSTPTRNSTSHAPTARPAHSLPTSLPQVREFFKAQGMPHPYAPPLLLVESSVLEGEACVSEWRGFSLPGNAACLPLPLIPVAPSHQTTRPARWGAAPARTGPSSTSEGCASRRSTREPCSLYLGERRRRVETEGAAAANLPAFAIVVTPHPHSQPPSHSSSHLAPLQVHPYHHPLRRQCPGLQHHRARF
jgi:hypothetical protein